MKVIVLGCKDYPAFKHARDVGGIETFCNDVLPRLDDMEFYVLARHYKGAVKREKLQNIEVIRMPFLNLAMLQTFTFNFLAFFRARRIKADCIWAHEPVAGFFAYWLNKLTKIPYVLHIHSRGSLEPANFNRTFWMRVMEHFAYKNAKQVIFVSSSISKDLEKPGIVIPVGIDIDKFKSSSIDPSLAAIKGKKICFIGRLSKVKGIDYIMQAYSRINQENLSLIIVGDGDEKSRLENLAMKLKLNNVHFLGYKASKNIMPYIDIFVMPSLSEGMPHIILDAIACKKPIVASSVGEIPKLIRNYLVRPRDAEALATAINKALNEKKLEKLPKGLDIDTVSGQIKNVFKSLG